MIKHVVGAVQYSHFGTFGYGMVEVNIPGLGLYVAVFTTRAGTLVSAIRIFLTTLEPLLTDIRIL